MPNELSPLRILVIDDDKAICEYVTTILEKDGFAVTSITNPLLAESAVREEDYHLVILDMMMPKMDGVEVLKALRKVDSDIAVVVFTGFPNLDTAVAAMKLEAVDYIKKPFQVEELREVVQRVMKKKGLTRDPEEQLHRAIGEIIRNRRKDANLTLKQMSKRTGLSVSLLSQIERAESSASIPSLYKIAVALETKLHQLFGDY
jgi:two-component system OmpR family response regulator